MHAPISESLATIAHASASLSNMTGSPFQIDVPNSLLLRAGQGDMRAFEQLYRLFERPAYTLALRMLGDPEHAREVLHDTMMKAFQRIAQFRGEAPFGGWLRQIALNETLMRLRRRRNEIGNDNEVSDIADESAAPWVLADAGALEWSLGELPTLTRSVIWLYHVEGYTHPEIADMLGKTVSFSKSQVARGTAKLRSLLTTETEPDRCPTYRTSMA
jgi:RNA polymerase sigma factor (sigma-70 family)